MEPRDGVLRLAAGCASRSRAAPRLREPDHRVGGARAVRLAGAAKEQDDVVGVKKSCAEVNIKANDVQWLGYQRRRARREA